MNILTYSLTRFIYLFQQSRGKERRREREEKERQREKYEYHTSTIHRGTAFKLTNSIGLYPLNGNSEVGHKSLMLELVDSKWYERIINLLPSKSLNF